MQWSDESSLHGPFSRRGYIVVSCCRCFLWCHVTLWCIVGVWWRGEHVRVGGRPDPRSGQRGRSDSHQGWLSSHEGTSWEWVVIWVLYKYLPISLNKGFHSSYWCVNLTANDRFQQDVLSFGVISIYRMENVLENGILSSWKRLISFRVNVYEPCESWKQNLCPCLLSPCSRALMKLVNWGVLLYGLFIRIGTPLAFFAVHSWEIVALTTSGNRVRHIVSSQDDAVAGLLGRWSWPTENKDY